MKLKCIAIDDEPLALEIISGYIKQSSCLELLDVFTNGVKALDFVNENTVDLLFVDIQMPDLNGFQLIERLNVKPMIIFTTAYGEYALEGFKVNAIDYLLKPVDKPDFDKAVAKAYSWFSTQVNIKFNKNFLFIKSEYKIIRVNFDDIIYVQGMSEYVKIHTVNTKPVMSLLSLKLLESQLPSDRFMRVHKSFIVNLDKVNIVERGEIYFEDGTIVPVSQQYKDKFNHFLESNFLL
ncbi:MAG: LytR/AlgR family response regulator transcription factor [Tannerellaceae bacterium]